MTENLLGGERQKTCARCGSEFDIMTGFDNPLYTPDRQNICPQCFKTTLPLRELTEEEKNVLIQWRKNKEKLLDSQIQDWPDGLNIEQKRILDGKYSDATREDRERRESEINEGYLKKAERIVEIAERGHDKMVCVVAALLRYIDETNKEVVYR